MPQSRRPSLRSALKKGPVTPVRPIESIDVNDWRVDFVRITHPQNLLKRPIVILSGIFQSYQGFQEELEVLAENYPVYMIDLPGLGENEQAAGKLSFEEMSDILNYFLDVLGIEKASILAFSTSGSIAYKFANDHPDKVGRVCFVGATPDYRSSIKACLKDALKELKEGHMESFASTMVMTFMNHSKKEKVRHAQSMGSQLYQKLLDLDPKGRQRYAENIARLIEQPQLSSGPGCPLLVVAGEYDNFTTAYEGYLLIQKCRQGKLAIIKSSDHLVANQKKTQILNTLTTFFDGDELDGLRGVKIWQKSEFPISARRLHPRWKVGEEATVRTGQGEYRATIDEISVEGCSLSIELKETPFGDQDVFELDFPKWGLNSELLVFEVGQAKRGCVCVRALFRHPSFEVAEKTEKIVQQMATKAA